MLAKVQKWGNRQGFRFPKALLDKAWIQGGGGSVHVSVRKGRIVVEVTTDGRGREIVKRLLAEGFEFVKVSGSHHKFRKRPITVTMLHPKQALPVGIARAVARLAGWM